MKVIAMMVLTTSTSILYMVLKFILAAVGVTHVLLPFAIIGVIITGVCYHVHMTNTDEKA